MLRRVVSTALASRARPVLVVLGASEGEARSALDGLACEVVSHARWREGQSSSIEAGVRRLRSVAPDAAAVLVLLGDQPFVTAATLDALIRAHEAGAPIAASERDGMLRVPALFAARFFDELLSLCGDRGARDLLERHRADVAVIPLPDGEEIDLDTPEDLARVVPSS